jgi:hypothetical protein
VSAAKSAAWICPKCSQKKRSFSLHHLRACKGTAARVAAIAGPSPPIATAPTVSPLEAAWAEASADYLAWSEAYEVMKKAEQTERILLRRAQASEREAQTIGPRPAKVPT